MKSYTITAPSLDGLLSDDYLYFEGLKKPSALFTIRDGLDGSGKSIEILEKYFNDIYNLFLRKLSAFVSEETSMSEESTKLQALLQEMIKVKGLIGAASEKADQFDAD